MVEIRANFESFKEAEEGFQRALRELESTIDTLENSLELTLFEWNGEARRAYDVARTAWEQAARDMHAELARLHKAIKRGHRNFRSSTTANVRMWSE